MWSAFVFIGYLVLALLIPTAWVLVPVWRTARAGRSVMCPAAGHQARVYLDPWYAVRMRAAGEDRARVRDCELWMERSGCGRECLQGFGSR